MEQLLSAHEVTLRVLPLDRISGVALARHLDGADIRAAMEHAIMDLLPANAQVVVEVRHRKVPG